MNENIHSMSRDKIEVLFSENIIKARIEMLAKEISESSRKTEGDLLVISLLKGAFIFTADMIRALHRHKVKLQLDFMTLASYGKAKESTGSVVIHSDLKEPVRDRKILLLDDILESGRTLAFASQLLKERGARSVSICVLMEKPGKLVHDVRPEHVGFIVPDKFVVGYGLDYANYYRELPYIAAVMDGKKR
jgi:hypoxanthine phosphoribosyltransferase